MIEQLERCVRNGSIGKSVLVSPQNELEELAAAGIVYSVRRILEDAVALSDGTKVSFPEYEWDKLRGMRDRLAHDHAGTDPEFVWDAIQHEVPKLRQLCLDFFERQGL